MSGGLVVLLGGFPGIGKETVGRLLSERIGGIFLPQHATDRVVFEAAGIYRGIPMSTEIWRAAMDLRQSFLRAMSQVLPEGATIVSTAPLYRFTADSDEMFEANRLLAEAREDEFLSILLHCPYDEHVRRVASSDRVGRGKMADPRRVPLPDFDWRFENCDMTIDTGGRSPKDVAREIADVVAARLEAAPAPC